MGESIAEVAAYDDAAFNLATVAGALVIATDGMIDLRTHREIVLSALQKYADARSHLISQGADHDR